MKNIVLYKSKYGNTRQYATWIAEELNWEIRDFSDFKKSEVSEYEHVIFGTGVYMGKMNKLKEVLSWFKDKPIMIFACAGNNNVQKDIDDIKRKNFSEDQLRFHQFFYLPGGVDFSKATGMTKRMLDVFQKVMVKKKNKTVDQMAILKGFEEPTDYVDRKEIESIITFARKQAL